MKIVVAYQRQRWLHASHASPLAPSASCHVVLDVISAQRQWQSEREGGKTQLVVKK